MYYLVVGTLCKRRINIAEWYHALRCQSSGEGNGMLFGDAYIENTLRHLLLHHAE